MSVKEEATIIIKTAQRARITKVFIPFYWKSQSHLSNTEVTDFSASAVSETVQKPLLLFINLCKIIGTIILYLSEMQCAALTNCYFVCSERYKINGTTVGNNKSFCEAAQRYT